jgi:hypothetical protein
MSATGGNLTFAFVTGDLAGYAHVMSMDRFISLWTHPDYPPTSVTAAQLEDAERRLLTKLPLDYREAILDFGLPRTTIELLDAICDRQLDIANVGDFLTPQEIVEVTEAWRDLGLPEELVAFATDGVGNLFCFPTDESESDQQPVFLWDHDSKDIDAVAPSFSAWIDGFCGIAPH